MSKDKRITELSDRVEVLEICIDELAASVAWLKTGYRVLDQPHPKSGEAP